MLESEIQAKVIKWFEDNHQALVIKHITSNVKGLPDLQVLLPNGRHFFIEIKK